MTALKLRQHRISRPELRRLGLGLLFISPWLLGFLLWTIYPMASSLFYSFTRYDLLRPAAWIGLGNYTDILTRDPAFGTVAYNTVYYVLLGAPIGVGAAFLLASLLNSRLVGRSFFRALFYFPSVVPAVVSAVVWQFLLNTQYGAVNAVLAALGLPAIPFLSSPGLAKPSLILINTWAQGTAIVIFLAALQEVPRSLYEAAIVDGANAWHKFRHITLPMCSPVILFNLIMALVWGFQDFTLPWLLTQGGPNQATELFSVFLYRNAFIYLRMGKASALAWMLFITVVLFTIVMFRTSAKWVYYGGDD